MNNSPIGILDSGVGGLTIWKEIVSLLPQESTIYIADSKNCPYGSRPAEQVYTLARAMVSFLVKRGCKLIVVACNTITVACIDKLRAEFKIPIVGTVPVVKTAAKRSKSKRIGILSTLRTAQSAYQRDLIKRFASDCEVINLGTDKLVSLIEEGKQKIKVIQIILQKELQSFKDADIDILALGCSHFPLIRDQIQKVLGSKVLILDSGAAIAWQVARILEANNAVSNHLKASYWFFITGSAKQNKVQFSEILRSMGYNDKAENIIL